MKSVGISVEDLFSTEVTLHRASLALFLHLYTFMYPSRERHI